MQAATKASVAVALCTAVQLHGAHVLLLVEAVESSHNTEGEWGVHNHQCCVLETNKKVLIIKIYYKNLSISQYLVAIVDYEVI